MRIKITREDAEQLIPLLHQDIPTAITLLLAHEDPGLREDGERLRKLYHNYTHNWKHHTGQLAWNEVAHFAKALINYLSRYK